MRERIGKFITFEGIEGCGKSTQQNLLANWLRNRGFEVVATKEPGGTQIGRGIREILLHIEHHHMSPACEALLYLADRAQHHHEVVKPALERGAWIVCDRYHDSTLAYQGAARGLEAEKLDNMFQIATGGLQPDLTILLDMDPERGLERAKARNLQDDTHVTEGRFEEEALQFHLRVRLGFLQLAQLHPRRFILVNADQTPEEVASAVLAIVKRRWHGHV